MVMVVISLWKFDELLMSFRKGSLKHTSSVFQQLPTHLALWLYFETSKVDLIRKG